MKFKAYDNFLHAEIESQGDQLNQTDVLHETMTKRKVFFSSFREKNLRIGQTPQNYKSQVPIPRTNVFSFY